MIRSFLSSATSFHWPDALLLLPEVAVVVVYNCRDVAEIAAQIKPEARPSRFTGPVFWINGRA